MSRMYTISFTGVAVTAAQDLFALVPGANRPVRIAGIMLSQTTDYGDAQEEGLPLLLRRGQTTVGSGGSVGTAVRIDASDAAAGFTARVNDTTQASGGSPEVVFADSWNVRMPYLVMFPPEMRPTVDAAGNRMTLELAGAPADSITMRGTLWVEELP
jgi:hypothetical protein